MRKVTLHNSGNNETYERKRIRKAIAIQWYRGKWRAATLVST